MGDAVEVVFQVDQPGTAAAKLKTLNEMMERLGRTAKSIGIDIDKTVRNMSADMDEFAARLQKSAAAQSQLGAAAQKGAPHLGAVRTHLSGIADIPGIPAADGLNGLLNSAGGLGLLLGGVLLGLEKINTVFVSIKEESQRLLHVAEKYNQLNRTGIKGGLDESQSDFEKIRKLRDEVMSLNDRGFTAEATAMQVQVMGRAMTMSEMNSKFDQAKRRLGIMGGDTADPAVAIRLKAEAELQKKRTGDFNELNQLRLTQQVQDMDHADKMRKVAFDTQTELAKRAEDAFKADFMRAQKLGSLFDEGEKLRAGLGGADVRARNAGIDAEKRDLGKQIMEAMLSGREFGQGGRRDLLDRFGALGQTSVADRLSVEATARNLQRGQDALGAAGSDKLKQSFALDAILSATSNIGSLTSDQVDARLKAIEQKTGIDQELKVAEAAKADAFRDGLQKKLDDITKLLAERNGQGVTIKLQDDSKGTLSAELDATPTPESSGAVPLNQSSAFRNDPMSGRL